VTLHFGILGPLEARRFDTPLELGPPKQKAVLAALLISANQVVSLDRLVEMLWGDGVPARAQGSLQAYIYNLRKVLEPGRAVRSQGQVLVTRPPGYVMNVDPDALDAGEFEILAAQGHRLLAQAHPDSARERLTRALALWRGPALAEFAFEQFAQPEAARLEQVRAVVHEDLLEAELALGNHAAVVADVTVAVGEHPLRERLWSLLMLALYRSGRQADALRAFAMARHTLAEELGIDPSPGLRALEAAILAQSPELEYYRPEAWTEEPPMLDPITAPRGVGAPETSSLVGREDQLRCLLDTMSQAGEGRGGVVLISGQAGIGKTRLADEVASQASRSGWPVAWGRASEREGAPPYWLWIQILTDLLRQSDPEVLSRALAGRNSVLGPLMPNRDDADNAAGTGEATDVTAGAAAAAAPSPSARFALFEAVTGFLLDLAEARALVVVLEDLQWSDQLSLQLLEHVASRCQTGHVLVLATCRPPENYCATPLTEMVGALARLPVFDWIELEGLNCREVGRLIAQAGSRASPAQVSDIHARTEGNPFFVSDFARLLATRDVPGPYHPGLLPSAVRAVIRRNLSRLPDQTHRLLVVAAAMGREFDIRTVAAASRAKLDDAVDWVHPAALIGIVTEDLLSPGSYRFCNDLVRDTLQNEVAGLRRSAIHAFANRVTEARANSDANQADRQQEAYG
jgi:DNA-binding SARP family transcriptional activator